MGPEGEVTDIELNCTPGLHDNARPLCLPSSSSTAIGSFRRVESDLRPLDELGFIGGKAKADVSEIARIQPAS